eukprot:Amastigsp_a292_21.p4 type:complete len:122 gc:universal Amastigsp_a292_21:506-141(-)
MAREPVDVVEHDGFERTPRAARKRHGLRHLFDDLLRNIAVVVPHVRRRQLNVVLRRDRRELYFGPTSPDLHRPRLELEVPHPRPEDLVQQRHHTRLLAGSRLARHEKMREVALADKALEAR